MSGVKRKFRNNTLLSKIVPHNYTGHLIKIIAIYIIIILILSMISLPLVSIIGAKEEVQVKSVETVSKESTVSTPSTTSSSESSTPSTTSSATKESSSPSTTTSSSKESTPTTSTPSESSSSSTSTPTESSSSSTPSESSTPTSSSTSSSESTSSAKSTESSSTVKATASVSTTSTKEKSDVTVTEIEPVLYDADEDEEKTPTQFETIETTDVKTTYSLQQKEGTAGSQNNDSQQQSSVGTTQNIETTLESDLGDISKDQQLTITTEEEEKEATIIHKVDFTASKDSKNVKLQVSHLKEKPVEIEQELPVSSDAKVYQYVDIKLTENDSYIGESGIETMSFTFVVEKQWIRNNSLDKDTIKMIRYHNGSWQQLNTSYVNETEDMLYYEAYTPGLSVFAVVGESIVEDSDAIVDGSTPIPWWVSFGVIASSSMILGVVLVKKRFIYRT